MKSKKYVTYAKKKFCIDENEKSEFELYHEVRDLEGLLIIFAI